MTRYLFLAERRFHHLEWAGGKQNDYFDWFDFNDQFGFFREGAD